MKPDPQDLLAVLFDTIYRHSIESLKTIFTWALQIKNIKRSTVKTLTIILVLVVVGRFVMSFVLFNIDLPELVEPAIAYDHLSDEETDPFLLNGVRPIDFKESNRHKKKFIRAIKKWPSARSCLVWSERRKETPDLRKINWRKMKLDSDISMCMFRIFSSLGSVERTKWWFMAQGLKDIRSKSRSRTSYRGGERIKTEIINVNAANYPTKTGSVYVPSTGVGSHLIQFVAYGESFSVVWSIKGKLLSTWHGLSVL